MEKLITKASLKNTKRLKLLERDMFTVIKNSEGPMSVDKIKSSFGRRASYETTKGIVAVSDLFESNDLSQIKVNQEAEVNRVIVATVEWKLSGNSIRNCYVSGNYEEPPSGISGPVYIVDGCFTVEVVRGGAGTSPWTFTTVRIDTADGQREAAPVISRRKSECIKTKPKT